MKFGLRTFLFGGMLFSVFLALQKPIFKLLQIIPPFFLPLFLLFGILLFSSSEKKTVPDGLLFFLLMMVGSSLFLLSEGNQDRLIRQTILKLQENLDLKEDAWGNPIQEGSAGPYSFGPDQQDNLGYYDDIGPAISWFDTFRKNLRLQWIFRRNLFLFFGFIFLSLFYLLFQKTRSSTSPKKDSSYADPL